MDGNLTVRVFVIDTKEREIEESDWGSDANETIFIKFVRKVLVSVLLFCRKWPLMCILLVSRDV